MRHEITVDEFEQLYRTTAQELSAYIRRRKVADPENVVAEVFAIAWRRRADLPTPLLRRAWLFGAARRLLLSEARVRGREHEAVERVARFGDRDTTGPDDSIEEVVGRALTRLGPEERELIQLVEWERMTPAEIAVMLGIRPGTARVRIHRARQALAADPELRELLDHEDVPVVSKASGTRQG